MTGARYVRIKRFAELTGYTEKAVYRKIADGVWIQGREYRRAARADHCRRDRQAGQRADAAQVRHRHGGGSH